MTLFYQKALEDELLAPFFIDEIGEDLHSEEWEYHIELLADFWLAHLNGENTYRGNFFGAHVKVPNITPNTFTNWLILFGETANQVYTVETAQRFKDKGVEFSKKFITFLKEQGH